MATIKRIRRGMAMPVSYRRFSVLLVTVALLLLAISLVVRYRFYTRYEPLFRKHAAWIDEMMELQENAQYTVRIFENISEQLAKYPQMDDRKLQNLKAVYEEKRGMFGETLKRMTELAEKMNREAETFGSHVYDFPFGLEDAYREQIKTVSLSLANVSRMRKEWLPEPALFETLQMEAMLAGMAPIGPELKTLRVMADRQSGLHNNRFYRFVEYSTAMLFLLLMLLAFLIRRILHVGVKYAETSIGLLARHEYDVSRLPAVHDRFQEERELLRQMKSVLEEQAFLDEVKNAAARGYVIEDVMENLFRHIRERMPVDRIDLLHVNANRRTASTVSTVTESSSSMSGRGFVCTLDEEQMKRCLEAEKAAIIADMTTVRCGGVGKGCLVHLAREGVLPAMILPLFLNGFIYAFLVFGSSKTGQFGEQEERLGVNIAAEISALLEKTLLTKTMFSKLATSFAELVDRKDNETGFHIERMVAYSTLIAQGLVSHSDPEYKLNPQVVRDIENNAAIHDIGKVAIPDAILKKPGKLDAAEWEIMRTHAAVGADILHEIRDELEMFRQNFYEVAENIARYHHERWDGSGYPEGLRSSDIPLEARIVAVADVFDALSTKRAYKDAWSLEDTFAELQHIAGSHLDPVLISLFLSREEEVREIFHRYLQVESAG